MSNGGFHGRTERVRQAPHYDQVSLPGPDPLDPWDQQLLREQSVDPLPPPPLPDHAPVGPEDEADPALDIKPVHRFIPDSWKSFFRRSARGAERSGTGSWSMPASSCHNNSTTGGVPCSPPHSPSLPRGGGSSCDSQKELLDGSGSARTQRTVLSYSQRVEEYHQRYAYMKSWAGLLRILGCVELLLGAAVFACVCAYVHKDNEWFNMFGYSSPGQHASGYYDYSGPKTPFVLVVAGLVWLVTVVVLVLGMTMYYRTILLDSSWWPLTEFTINLVLALLYLAAGSVYVRDTLRGGLCYNPVFNNPVNGMFCRTEAGQTAAIVFLFFTMVLYIIGAIVCLKLWRHEAARQYRERYSREMVPAPVSGSPDQVQDSSVVPARAAPAPAKVVPGTIPAGHIPKPVVVPDYIAKYPTVQTDEERDQYRAVFNDQYAEYKELHAEVQLTLKKFDEMDAMMRSLPPHAASQMEADRISRILQEYQKKKNDPTFLEKKERCEYLKSKLSHIKQKIQEYDKVMEWNDGYS